MLAPTIASWVGHRMWEAVSVAGNFGNIIIARFKKSPIRNLKRSNDI